MRKYNGLCKRIDHRAAVHHSSTAMHHLRGMNARLSAVSIHFSGGIFSRATLCSYFEMLNTPAQDEIF